MARQTFEETSFQVLEIQNASGSIAKTGLLRKYKDNETLTSALRFIFNPYAKTGISDAKLSKGLATITLDNAPEDCTKITVFDAIKYFSEHTTGSDQDVITAALFIRGQQRLSPGCMAVEEFAKAVITHDLKIGATATTLNQVYGAGFIPKVGCMLGTHISKVNPKNIQWPCIVTEKLDGIRRILIKRNGNVRLFSRSGHEDFGLVDIIEAAKYLPDNYVYDGELLAAGIFKDCIAQRQATNSIANSKGIRHGIAFNVFDMVPVEEFDAGVSTKRAIDRKMLLAATLGDEDGLSILCPEDWARMSVAFNCWQVLSPKDRDAATQYIKPVKVLGIIKSVDEATTIVEPIWARHGEGVMLNTVNGLYEVKRSKELLKIKFAMEMTLKCIGVEEGSGRNEGTLGAIVVDYKGNKVGVGSGFDDYTRRQIWNNPGAYIGRMVEVETFGESTNAAGDVSINCPIFKRFVGDEE